MRSQAAKRLLLGDLGRCGHSNHTPLPAAQQSLKRSLSHKRHLRRLPAGPLLAQFFGSIPKFARKFGVRADDNGHVDFTGKTDFTG